MTMRTSAHVLWTRESSKQAALALFRQSFAEKDLHIVVEAATKMLIMACEAIALENGVEGEGPQIARQTLDVYARELGDRDLDLARFLHENPHTSENTNPLASLAGRR